MIHTNEVNKLVYNFVTNFKWPILEKKNLHQFNWNMDFSFSKTPTTNYLGRDLNIFMNRQLNYEWPLKAGFYKFTVHYPEKFEILKNVFLS